MATTWPAKFPIFQTGADRFAKRVEAASDGHIQIHVYAAGELIPALEVFNAVSTGTVELGSGLSSYWSSKVRAAQWFTSIPFGLNAQSTMLGYIVAAG
jgi:TRAP-type mannitol/chloroaromatic compound transport system substrate-binding protein